MTDFNLKISNSGSINEANIDIGKINVVGGVNSSGKTTVAKLLYCFLKIISDEKEEFLYNEFAYEVKYFIKEMKYHNGKLCHHLNGSFTTDEKYANILRDYNNAKKIFFDYDIYKTAYPSASSFEEGYNAIFGKMDDLISLIDGTNEHLNYKIMELLLNEEHIFPFLDSNPIFQNTDFKMIFDDKASFNIDPFISNVFYMDTVSILDLKGTQILYKEHVRHLRNTLNEKAEEPSDKAKEIFLKIEHLIKGKFQDYDIDFGFSKDESDEMTFSNSTPSGIKQIGVIQILLSKGKLKPGSFLIIDEPEVNLHPEWQIKFAEILVLLAKELNITIYLNSHSPMFIEAMSLYSQYYDLLNKTYFYLTEEQDNGKFNFKKIDPTDMGEVYENLTKPYDELDKVKAKILFKE